MSKKSEAPMGTVVENGVERPITEEDYYPSIATGTPLTKANKALLADLKKIRDSKEED